MWYQCVLRSLEHSNYLLREKVKLHVILSGVLKCISIESPFDSTHIQYLVEFIHHF